MKNFYWTKKHGWHPVKDATRDVTVFVSQYHIDQGQWGCCIFEIASVDQPHLANVAAAQFKKNVAWLLVRRGQNYTSTRYILPTHERVLVHNYDKYGVRPPTGAITLLAPRGKDRLGKDKHDRSGRNVAGGGDKHPKKLFKRRIDSVQFAKLS